MELGWPRLEPTCDDFVQGMGMRGFSDPLDAKNDSSNKVFTIPSSLALPKKLGFTIANLKTIGRKAGTEANQKSAAATAWVLANSASDFVAAPMAWSGSGSHKPTVYHNIFETSLRVYYIYLFICLSIYFLFAYIILYIPTIKKYY